MAGVQVLALVAYGGFLLATFGRRALQSSRAGGGLQLRKPVSRADAIGETTCLLGCVLSLLAPPLAMAGLVDPLRIGWPAIQGFVCLVGTVLGTVIAVSAQRHLGEAWRTGVEVSGSLVTTGPFARVRNPFYVGWFLAAAAVVVAVPSAVALAGSALHVAAAHVIVRAVEEPTLARAHGADYVRYKQRTRRFLPRLTS